MLKELLTKALDLHFDENDIHRNKYLAVTQALLADLQSKQIVNLFLVEKQTGKNKVTLTFDYLDDTKPINNEILFSVEFTLSYDKELKEIRPVSSYFTNTSEVARRETIKRVKKAQEIFHNTIIEATFKHPAMFYTTNLMFVTNIPRQPTLSRVSFEKQLRRIHMTYCVVYH
jgi:hypothetical protein